MLDGFYFLLFFSSSSFAIIKPRGNHFWCGELRSIARRHSYQVCLEGSRQRWT